MNMFTNSAGRKPQRNKFNLSHERKFSFDQGWLVPHMVQEILPGDSFKVNTEVLVRYQALIAPILHRLRLRTEYFFVPNRLVWDEWEDFITGGRDGNAAPVFPTIQTTSSLATLFANGTLADYLGVPTSNGAATVQLGNQISALPFRAYQLIWNEWYQDANLYPEIDFDTSSGLVDNVDMPALMSLRRRTWEKDYFTTALPYPQRGGEAELPIGQIEPNYLSVSQVRQSDGTTTPVTDNTNLYHANGQVRMDNPDPANSIGIQLQNLDTMDIDPVTINTLRRANAIQEWLEISARGGSRYIETMFSQFGVKSSDARLQRPEYLGGGSQPVVISEVLSTATDPGQPIGYQAGHAISVGGQHGFTRSFEEHGFVIGILSIMPKSAYTQGLPRHFFKFDKFDYFWKSFAHLGEQEILNKEIYFQYENGGNNEGTWGYQQRYAEYKYNPSTVHGDLRTSLSFWHKARIFDELPPLNEIFVEGIIDKREFAVTTPNVHSLVAQVYHSVSALRPLPYYAIPEL